MDLPPWAQKDTHVVPLTARARESLAWFHREGRAAVYMRVGEICPHDEVPIHLIACDQNGAALGSQNLWANRRGAPNGWSDEDWGTPPEPERPTFWEKLSLGEEAV